MKFMKNGLRLWIAAASVTGFMGGWVLLAHSPKPAPLQTKATVSNLSPLPTLAPLPSFNQPSSSGFQPLPALPQVQTGFSHFRTGGS